jgi:hypothetical protein
LVGTKSFTGENMDHQKWEYKVLSAKFEQLQEWLNDEGKIGWELVSVGQDREFYVLMLKRPKS